MFSSRLKLTISGTIRPGERRAFSVDFGEGFRLENGAGETRGGFEFAGAGRDWLAGGIERRACRRKPRRDRPTAPDRLAISVAAATAAWLLVRQALTAGWIGPGLATPKVFGLMLGKILWLEPFRPWEGSWAAWWANVAAAFRWTWVLLVVAIGWEWRSERRATAFALGAALAVTTGLTFLVFDVARSVGFAFPAIPVALAWAARHHADRTRQMARVLAWLGLLTPSYWITSRGYFWWWRPLALRLVAHYTGQDPLDWWR